MSQPRPQVAKKHGADDGDSVLLGNYTIFAAISGARGARRWADDLRPQGEWTLGDC
jgi:hypothetical protein